MNNEPDEDLQGKGIETTEPQGQQNQVNSEGQQDRKKPTRNAARVANHRQRQADAGLVMTWIPVELLSAVRKEGGWDAWLAARKKVVLPPPDEVQVTSRLEPSTTQSLEIHSPSTPKGAAPAVTKLTSQEMRSINIGRKVLNLTGFKKSVVFNILGI